MQRDMKLLREILLEVEGWTDGRPHYIQQVVLDGYGPEELAYHARLLVEGGYLLGSITPVFHKPPYVLIQRLSWEGHDFLDAIRDHSVFEKTMAVVKSKFPSASLSVLKAVAIEVARALLQAHGIYSGATARK